MWHSLAQTSIMWNWTSGSFDIRWLLKTAALTHVAKYVTCTFIRWENAFRQKQSETWYEKQSWHNKGKASRIVLDNGKVHNNDGKHPQTLLTRFYGKFPVHQNAFLSHQMKTRFNSADCMKFTDLSSPLYKGSDISIWKFASCTHLKCYFGATAHFLL